MSDELRDLLKTRAGNAPVPNDDLGDVIRGGKALRWRKRLYSASVVALVGVLSLTAIPQLLSSGRKEETRPPITNTPSPDSSGLCKSVPFRATYLPDGWSYVLRPGSGGSPQPGEGHLGYFAPLADEAGTYIDITEQGHGHKLAPGEALPVKVLGNDGRLGAEGTVGIVEFTYKNCDYSMAGVGMTVDELFQVAEGLRPTDSCEPKRVTGPDANLKDGRHFVYITGVDVVDHGMGIQFDRAEFLTGAEANEAAVAAGAIEEGESVPNDYFILNQSKRTEALGFAEDVEVHIQTLQDGMPGLAPADTLWLACAFAARDRHSRSPYWITVRDQQIVRIEEQYLP